VTFSPRFRYQLVNQAVVGSDLGKQTAHPRGRLAAPLYLRAGELGGLCHE
jgi:hypothetical protein